MKNVPISELEAGMVLADSVTTTGGQQLFSKGTTLNERIIMRLSFYHVDSVSIEQSRTSIQPHSAEKLFDTSNKPVPKVTSTTTQRVEYSKQFQTFQIDHSFMVSSIMDSFRALLKSHTPLPADTLLAGVSKLFDSCKTSRELFDMLHNMRSSGESIFSHSLNVALICRQLGKWLKVTAAQSDMLTLCGLFHDIGKLQIPSEIFNKPGTYTAEEFALVKKHPLYGYELLRSFPLDEHIKKAALSHHERCDGSGYPNGLKQDKTDTCAMIVAIADVYDAMTTARPHRAPLCPFQVIANFEKEGLQKYNPKYILTFLSHIATIYQNNRILLSDGRCANIVMLNQNALSKPIIQLDDGSCIDLSTQNELHIQSVM